MIEAIKRDTGQERLLNPYIKSEIIEALDLKPKHFRTEALTVSEKKDLLRKCGDAVKSEIASELDKAHGEEFVEGVDEQLNDFLIGYAHLMQGNPDYFYRELFDEVRELSREHKIAIYSFTPFPIANMELSCLNTFLTMNPNGIGGLTIMLGASLEDLKGFDLVVSDHIDHIAPKKGVLLDIVGFWPEKMSKKYRKALSLKEAINNN